MKCWAAVLLRYNWANNEYILVSRGAGGDQDPFQPSFRFTRDWALMGDDTFRVQSFHRMYSNVEALVNNFEDIPSDLSVTAEMCAADHIGVNLGVYAKLFELAVSDNYDAK